MTQALDDILASLTPDSLRQLIDDIADAQPEGEHSGVGVGSVVFRLVAGRDIGAGAERSAAYMKLMAAIESLVPAIGGMRYIKAQA